MKTGIGIGIAFARAAFTASSLVVLISLICGCAPTRWYGYPGHGTFTESNIAALRVGMSADEVRSVFGPPDEEYAMGFGADVGEEWTGTVWVYFTESDRSLMYVKRYKKNTLVFSASTEGLKLNHWSLEP